MLARGGLLATPLSPIPPETKTAPRCKHLQRPIVRLKLRAESVMHRWAQRMLPALLVALLSPGCLPPHPRHPPRTEDAEVSLYFQGHFHGQLLPRYPP